METSIINGINEDEIGNKYTPMNQEVDTVYLLGQW